MKYFIYTSLALLLSIACSAQGTASAQLVAEQLEDLALDQVSAIELHQLKGKTTIQAPSDTYMLEVINAKGKLVAQDPFDAIMTIDTRKWDKGTYTILAHTFSGLIQEELAVGPTR